MITTIKIANLKDVIANRKSFTIDQLITNILLGTDNSKTLVSYDETKTYDTGDKIPYITDTGELLVIVAIRDNISGPFNPKDWEEFDILTELQGIIDDSVILSWEKPNLRRNKVWLEIKNESVDTARDLGVGLEDGKVIVYNNLVISARKPTLYQGVIWGAITEQL